MSRDIPVALIDPDPEQPRQHFAADAIAELAQSLAGNGLVVPVLVRPVGARFTLVHGERRWRAAQQLGWTTIPTEVRDLTPEDARWLALVENIQRADLSPIDEAQAYQAHLAAGLTQQALGARIGKTQSYIAQKLRLFTLPAAVQVLLAHDALGEGHGRQLLRLREWGHGVTAPLASACVAPPAGADAGTAARTLEAMTLPLRPMAYPVLGLPPRTPAETGLFVESLRALHDAAATHAGRLPLWEVWAAWWALWAVRADASVLQLHLALDGWRARLLSAICWWDLWGAAGPPPPTAGEDRWHGAAQWWGYWDDLKHSGLLDLVQQQRYPDGFCDDYMALVMQPNRCCLPSAMQPYGPWANAGREILAFRARLAAEALTGDDAPGPPTERAGEPPST